jgi:membrane associated rhomboid family serine protease
MFVPLSTDAPIYHYPRGTIGLIIVNVLAWLLTEGGAEEHLIRFGLSHGDGLQPLQWVTSNFIHYGFFHLLGNMLFLWGFGLVVEGKIGTLAYVLVYMGIGTLQCAIEQLVYTTPGPPSFGASAILFGLMAMALIWAPSNEVTVFYWILMRMGTFDISIFWYSVISLVYSLAITGLLGTGLSSEVMHLMGAVIGGSVGFSMLLTRTVDCEGWDLISVLRGRTPQSDRFVQREGARAYGQKKLKRKLKKSRDQVPTGLAPEQPLAAAARTDRFHQLVKAGKPQAAYAELQQVLKTRPDWQPEAEDLRWLGKGLRKNRQFEPSLEINLRYLKQTGFRDAEAIFWCSRVLRQHESCSPN